MPLYYPTILLAIPGAEILSFVVVLIRSCKYVESDLSGF